MSKRIANMIVLVEDVTQQNLVRRYLEECGHNARVCRFLRAAARTGGSGEKYVRDQYPIQVQACRSAVGRRASALLIVMVDADMNTTQHRTHQLSASLNAANMPPLTQNDPIAVLIPKRHVETWIRALQGNQVDEQTDYTDPAPTPIEIRKSAATLYQWTRPGATVGTTSPRSLTASLPEWQKVP